MRALALEQQAFREYNLRIGSGAEATHEGRDLILLPDQVVIPVD
jgi:hypothetical protein